jgi:hypothetical protein
MTPKSKFTFRTQPDTLWRLCQRHGKGVLEAMDKGEIRTKGDSLKVKLVEYYVGMPDKWDRDQERKDWTAHNLASLKYETTRYLIRILASKGEWTGYNLNSEIGVIAVAIENQAYALALELCEINAPIAESKEDFLRLLQILEFQGQALDSLSEKTEVAKYQNEVSGRIADCMNSLQEIASCAKLRRTVFEPIKQEWDVNESIDKGQLAFLGRELEALNARDLRTSTARIDFLPAKILFSILTFDLPSAVSAMEELMKIYDNVDWVKVRNYRKYLYHLRAASLLFLQVGKWDQYQFFLRKLEKESQGDTGLEAVAKYALLFCYLNGSIVLNDKPAAMKSIKMFEDIHLDIEGILNESEKIKLDWLVLINCLMIEDFAKAHQICQNILDRKTMFKRDVLVNVRIAAVACCMVLNPTDEDTVLCTIKAAREFLDRNREDFPDAILVLKQFRMLWHSTRRQAFHNSRKIQETVLNPKYATYINGRGRFDFTPVFDSLRLIFKENQQ